MHSCRFVVSDAWMTIRVILIIFATGLIAHADDKPVGTLSDDGNVVTVAKTPDALKLADFSNHLGLIPSGTHVRILESQKDPKLPFVWQKVEILEGQYKGQSGWAIQQTVQVNKDQPIATEQQPKVPTPLNATHRVIKGTGIWAEPSSLSAASTQLSADEFVEMTSSKRDSVTSFHWIQVRVLSGKHKQKAGWIPSHDLKELPTPQKAILVVVGGARDETVSENVKSWATRLSYPNCVVQYVTHTDEESAVQKILEHLEKNMNGSVVIVGHSWGGDTAMDIANSLDEVGPGVRVELTVTLDAVSWFDVEQNFGGTKTKNIQKWINVWNKGTGFTDGVATLGGHWGGEGGALNIKLPRDETPITHADSKIMFDVAEVQTALKQALEYQVERSDVEQAAIKSYLHPKLDE